MSTVGTAYISPDRKYRYFLTREWDESRHCLLFIMLNPSTADACQDDATIRKCMGFARRLGYGGIGVVNLFAFRSRRPEALFENEEVVGPKNDQVIEDALITYETRVAAWGAWAARKEPERVEGVIQLARRLKTPLTCLRKTKRGEPCHPLMLPYSCRLSPYP